MSLPDPETEDLKITDGSSCPTYAPGLSYGSAHTERLLSQSGSRSSFGALGDAAVTGMAAAPSNSNPTRPLASGLVRFTVGYLRRRSASRRRPLGRGARGLMRPH